MPGQFLTHADRASLTAFPAEIAPETLFTFFTLSADDVSRIKRQRREHNQLGYALQLCAMRYLGFVPDDLDSTPVSVL